MHRAASGVLTALFLALAFAPAIHAADVDWSNVYRPGGELTDGMLVADRLIVHFSETGIPQIHMSKTGEVVTDQEALNDLARRFGVRQMGRLFPELTVAQKAAQPIERDLLYTVDFDGDRHALGDVARSFQGIASVTRVEPVGIHFMDANVPNDPSLGNQWWLRNTAYAGRDIRGIAGWYHETGSSSVVVAVADSGVDWMHPDLGGTGPDYTDGNIWINWTEYNGTPNVDDDGNGFKDDWHGWDWVHVTGAEQDPPQDAMNPDNDPMDYDGHGTWASGCVAAISNNGIGVSGTSWASKIMALRVGWLPDGSNLGVVRMDFAAQAMDYARINGAKIFNASWGSSDSGGLGTSTTLAINAGLIIITSAGNSDNQVASYLCSRFDVISVAATNQSDSKASFSSYGTWVDISAPGVGIYTTAYNRFGSGGSEHTYSAPDGTSFSSPITCGGAAIIWSAFPGYTRQQVIDTLLAAVDDLDARNPAYAGLLGSGRLNLAKIFDNPKWMVPEQLPTLLDAMNTADPGDEVAVLGGATIVETIQMPSWGVTINGGYDATYTTRDPVSNKSILQSPGGTAPVVQSASPVDTTNVLDGFVITGGKAQLVSFEPVDGEYGGGILIRSSSPKFVNCRIEGNLAGDPDEYGGGGGVAVLGGSAIFEDVEITGNTSLRGSGVYIHQGSPVFRNANIHDNISHALLPGLSPVGGGVYIVNAGAAKRAVGDVVTFTGGFITGHTVEGAGGGIYAQDSNLVLTGVEIANNVSSGDGAGVGVLRGSYTGSGNRFLGNTMAVGANHSGGGLSASAAVVSINGSLFRDNAANFGGGGIQLANCPSPSITGSFVVENSAAFFGSGAYLATCSGSTFSSNTVAANTGASAGANGLYLSAGDAAVQNSIFAFNGGGGASLADGVACSGSTVSFDCNLVWSNDAGNYSGVTDPTGTSGNVEADPQFCEVAASNYDIASTSPAAAANSGGCGDIGAGAASCGGNAVEDGPIGLPKSLVVQQNVPNPFNPKTEIRFVLPVAGHTTVRVFDLRGRLIRVLEDAELGEGEHAVDWDGRDATGRSVASGTYFYEVSSGDHRAVRKMGLIK